ncbi:type VII secretion AAA-ATPase EccA [Mycolicibacterium peregrinum]|uniref:type VII secretion AAA-ATPase EccA n=1 Tax=Mycolicibacterium peregrinum TaxID=43304 RepID=UPI003AAD1EFE
MGDLLAARKHFDRAMAIIDRQGREAALSEFEAATKAAPEMADAWLGRVAGGDVKLSTLEQLYKHRDSLQREMTRIGRRLSAEVGFGPHLGITVGDGSSAGLALAAARITAGEYAGAAELLDDDSLLDSWINHQWAQLARVYLHYTTKRWPDVLTAAATELPAQAVLMAEVTGSICALAGFAATYLGQGRVALDWVDRVDTEGQSRQSDRFGAEVVTATIDPGRIPLLAADLAYVRGMAHRQIGQEDKAQQWLSKATINGVLIPYAKDAIANASLQLEITDEETINSRADKWDVGSAKSRDEIDFEGGAEKRAQLLAEGRALLARQIGLASVKEAVAQLEDQLEVRAMRLEAGLKVQGATNHMLLVGPPGTGKTTTAQALGMIYTGLGLVRNPEVKEVFRSDFCHQNIGASGPKTKALIQDALGGVLFMDEFYTLVERHQDGTPDMIGMEAVGQLLIDLDKHRLDFCFIGAGYEDKVDEFLTVNPGLASRFNRKLKFESYSPTEIVEIGALYGDSRDTTLSVEARSAFVAAMSTVRAFTTPKGEHGIDAMHNGRFARNVMERAEELRDSKLVARKRDGEKLTADDLKLIDESVIVAAVREVCAEKSDMKAISW